MRYRTKIPINRFALKSKCTNAISELFYWIRHTWFLCSFPTFSTNVFTLAHESLRTPLGANFGVTGDWDLKLVFFIPVVAERSRFQNKTFCCTDFERLLLSFPTDVSQSGYFPSRKTYDFIYETTNFFINFHAIPFPRKGELLNGLDSAREITIYNNTVFSIGHRKLLYFEEEWIDERFTISHIN